jgi:hypothetical protein
MTVRMNGAFQLRFKLLESENSIREMESEIDFLKEQTLLMREAISKEQNLINRLRPRLERISQRENNHERV